VCKESNRKENERRRYLSSLARQNPKKFAREWAKRLHSWSVEANRNAKILTDEDGKPIPSTFSFVTMAMEVLKSCGQEAVELEGRATLETMTNACCDAVAKAVDPRLCQLNIYHSLKSGMRNENSKSQRAK
jgi:hypothetical protein